MGGKGGGFARRAAVNLRRQLQQLHWCGDSGYIGAESFRTKLFRAKLCDG